ncbi:diguanylate cyclase (GGDEF)-like protein [Clostridium algifaecis]|uniref:Diguanylate cyclase (GGDEF)-like protein n=1 Tax=Clostridium algifaecis TaxID=1472040 RepID=A0ABS4KTF2_9CLOT|nr:GGDEF and EAL domain-containing protein [Clostridium algifaecis]MBP2033307.1 diguanylate cyclase (GGDEF)-like protein [Clostridium algifaecis]
MNKSKIVKINEVYNRGISGGEIGIWEWNIEENYVFLSENCYRFIEYTNEKFNDFYECIDKFVLMEDRDRAIEELKLFTISNLDLYTSEVRILTKEGKEKWVLIKGKYSKNKKIISGSITDLSIKKQLENEIETVIYYDLITGLPNRNVFIEKLKKIIEKCKNEKSKSAVICVDIDNFNLINDTFGYEYGDVLLRIFSQVLSSLKNNINVFRISGNKFILILNQISNYCEIEEVCNKILSYCDKPFELIDAQVYISVSIGVACIPEDSLNESDIYRYVDLAMQQSKIKGNKMITFFDKSMYNKYLRKITIEQELRNAIKNEELYIVYQPQVDMTKHKIIGFEALLRWKNRKLGNISPAEFIPIAEQSGVIVEIGKWVINSACDKILELSKANYQLESVSVNISPVQLRNMDFLNTLENIIDKKNISPSMLEIEITEGTIIDLKKNNIDIFNKIIEKGFKIAIDDFGTGYSSLNYLTIVPFNTLKIDKSFIDGIEKGKNMAVISCILNLSKALNYKVIAEGVETELQMNKLLEIGSSIIQGYYFSKPIDEREIENLLGEF